MGWGAEYTIFERGTHGGVEGEEVEMEWGAVEGVAVFTHEKPEGVDCAFGGCEAGEEVGEGFYGGRGVVEGVF